MSDVKVTLILRLEHEDDVVIVARRLTVPSWVLTKGNHLVMGGDSYEVLSAEHHTSLSRTEGDVVVNVACWDAPRRDPKAECLAWAHARGWVSEGSEGGQAA